ncbi:MAG: SCP2 sterol-binding domain-containing protein [Paracoccus sp. (in: a-proteobacteria)]|uniref:ubiquinone anaerobic biosynthesis accessory factor UbiT n=1 Tax=Paracoccus sp. TaxID=267 RepID=UPI0026E0A741|nr:SCP2 sterol-binding domain-containing protein [Paracoccus sp. (in: a-proteobacteria)]MDO5620286.1 SCP2 sterol-binding domain-containing protein [Paracoccus sp. (in: a-proteobacteria)]
MPADHHATDVPRCPRPIALALRPLPLPLLGVGLSRFAARISDQHPGLLRRLGDYASRKVLIDPTDLPFTLLMDPAAGPRITAHRRHHAPQADARIAGPVAALVGMLHGQFDGDALFFARDLTIEGDTEAVLALRNALDDAELDLTEELAQLSGPFAPPLRRLVAVVEKLSGLLLHRAEQEGFA